MTAILRLSLPMTVWLVGFSAIYALHGLSCSRHWPAGVDRHAVLIAAAALGIGLQALICGLLLRSASPQHFMRWVTAALAAVALGASLWTWAPLLALDGCR